MVISRVRRVRRHPREHLETQNRQAPYRREIGRYGRRSADRVAAEALEFVQNFAQILRVELRRQGRGANQVIERNGQMPPLGSEILAGTRTLVSRYFWGKMISWDRS